MRKGTFFILIGGILSLIIAMGIRRFSYTPILPLIQKDLSFSNAIAGYLATSNYAGYLIGAILAGAAMLAQHRLFSLRISLIISILTTALMGIFHFSFIWYILRFLSGVASALVLVLASSIVIDELAAREKTNWSGIFFGGVGLGILITGLIILRLNQLFKWEGVWIGLAILGFIFLFFIWIFLKDPASNIRRKDNQEVFTRVPPTKWLPWLIASYGLEGLGYIVTGTFIVSIAAKSPSFNNNSTLVWVIVGLAAVPSCIIWSMLSKKWGLVKCLVLAMIFQSFGIVIPVIWLSGGGLIISALSFGATFVGITTLATILASKVSPYNSNRVIGYLTAVFGFGQMIGPTIAGILSSFSHNYNSSLIGASSVVLIGALLLLNGIKYETKSKT